MAELYLFTWNLNGETRAHDLAVEQLARRGKDGPFVACLQELPKTSWVAKARDAPQAELTSRNIAVVSTPGKVKGLALVHRADLVVDTSTADEDGEFIATVFQHPSAQKTIAIIGVHAKSKVDTHHPQDHGGSRALLRHAIHAFLEALKPKPKPNHQIVLGDFNSSLLSREMQSWHGFYALSSNRALPRTSTKRGKKTGAATRRGFDHPPLYVLRPDNEATGTFAHADTGGNENPTIDFIVVDEGTRANARAKILTAVAGKSVWSSVNFCPNLSDHLPVEGIVDI